MEPRTEPLDPELQGPGQRDLGPPGQGPPGQGPPDQGPPDQGPSDLSDVAKGKRLAWLLGVRETYQYLLSESVEREMVQVRRAFGAAS